MIIFDGSPGTNAPPATLGPYTMLPFAPDGRLPLGDPVTTVPSPFGGNIDLTPTANHSKIGTGWATWSHGYTGDVYIYTSQTFCTITLPNNTRAFYFYAEPNNFTSFSVTATSNTGTTSGPIPVVGSGGATYFGFYALANTTLTTIAVQVDVNANGFAIGEFGIAGPIIPCVHPDTIVKTLSGPKMIKDIKTKETVYDVNGKKVKVLFNIASPSTKKFIKVSKDSLGFDSPSSDLLIRPGHPIMIDGKEVMPENLDNISQIDLDQAVSVWSLCTKERSFVMMNGVPVATWSKKAWGRRVMRNPNLVYKKF